MSDRETTPDHEKLRSALYRGLGGMVAAGIPPHIMDRAVTELAALAAPVAVDIATALRFCTCSHWLEAHYERKCVEFACACQDFSPVVAVDETKLTRIISENTYQAAWGECARAAKAVAEWLGGGER